MKLRRFLEQYLRKKARKKFLSLKIGREKYEAFLHEVDKAVAQLMREMPEEEVFLERMANESTRWLNDLPEINIASFKAGTCYGIFTYCKLNRERSKKESYIV